MLRGEKMKRLLMLVVMTILVLATASTVFADTMTKTTGFYCYADGDKDYYEKATSVTKKRTQETYTFYEDNTMYQYLGQEQFQNGVKFFDSYTKNDVTPGWFC
jgi:uncharacterized protein YxeA